MASMPMQIISQNTVDWVIVKRILCVSEKKKALEGLFRVIALSSEISRTGPIVLAHLSQRLMDELIV